MAGTSIYDFIVEHLDEAGRLSDPGLRLPDEPEATDGIRWAPGAMDGVLGHHASGNDAAKRANEVAAAFVKACERGSQRRLKKLYDAVDDDSAIGYLDAMIERLVDLQPDRARLHEIARWLATTSADRSPVKVGIALLGVTGLVGEVGVVRALGAHEEFTLFAAVALTNGLEDPESELWALASTVDGWGRIQCVERLRGTTDPAIRAWILRQGYRNSVMYEYLAHIAATTGGLLEALRDGTPDRELLTAAGEILEALCVGGPAEDMSDYVDGADAVEAFLGQMTTRAETLRDFQSIASIATFLDGEEQWDMLASIGWTATRREAFERACEEILGRDSWDPVIYAGLDSDDGADYWLAEQAARRRGLDIFDIQVARIRREPLGGGWFTAWQGADDVRAVTLAALARELLPLDEIATGPSDAMGLGPGWQAHAALDWSLQALRDHPGIGAELVLAGLRSPVIRNRNMALNCLKEWPRERWPEGAIELARRLAESDPNEQAREFAAEVLAGA
ncbi:hypothetical protein [Nocardioides dilutus]